MSDDVVRDVNTRVESVVSAKMGELEERLSKLLSGCAKEASVRDESNALKALLTRTETRFMEENTALVEAINAHTEATNAQTALLGALCNEVKTMNERIDVLCLHTGRLRNIEGDVAAIAGTIRVVENKADAVTLDTSSLQRCVDDIRLVFTDKINEVRKADEALRPLFSRKGLERMVNGIVALKQWTGKTRATIVYDSDVDVFTHTGLFNKVLGKKNVALIGFTTDGDVFGGFYNVAVTEQGQDFNDPNMFVFSFESHGRCMTPQRFVVKDELKNEAVVLFFNDHNNGFGWFGVAGVGGFRLGNERSNSNCWNMSRGFDGLENTTLTGKNGAWREGPYHHCARLVAIQLV